MLFQTIHRDRVFEIKRQRIKKRESVVIFHIMQNVLGKFSLWELVFDNNTTLSIVLRITYLF